jgi:predicted O-methyltransferase YrrM
MAAGRRSVERVADICQTSSKDLDEATLLFKLVRLLRPSRCLELGTCLGITAAYIGLALKLNGGGDLVSIEGCPSLARIASENIRALGLANVSVLNARFQDILAGLLTATSFDFAWVDGHHDYDALSSYFEQIASHGAEDTVIVIDDIGWSDGMRSAWHRLRCRPSVTACVTIGGFGLCFTSRC